MSATKKIIVLGSGYSGSGAVFDYLAGRPDVYDPFNGREFRLIQDPGGITSLHYAVGAGFSINVANAAIHEFVGLCKRMGRSTKSLPPGLGYHNIFKDYFEKVNHYIDSITDITYHGIPVSEVAKLSFYKALDVRISRSMYKNRGKKPRKGIMYLPVAENVFLEKTKHFLDSLFDLKPEIKNKMPVLINQGGSFWKPLSSTQYYGDRHVIVVTRDPRDIYIEMQTKGYGYPDGDVTLFCNWYRNVIERINHTEWDKGVITHIRFEKFVEHFDEEKTKLDTALGLNVNVKSKYDVSKSRINIGKYNGKLSSKEHEIFHKMLGCYLKAD